MKRQMKVCCSLLLFVLIISNSYGSPGDVYDLGDAILASVEPNTALWGDPNTNQNPITIGDATWRFHEVTANTYIMPSVTPSVTFNSELPAEGRGWGMDHRCLVSYLSTAALTNYQIGDVGGHGGTGATWTADAGGTFLIEYSAFNARTAHNGRNMAFTLTVAGVVEDTIDVPDTTYPDSFNRYVGTPIIREVAAGENITLNATANDWMGIALTIKEIDASGGSLTIAVDPAHVNTVLPYVGTETQPVGAPIAINAPQYSDCPNNGEVRVFDHWVEGANVSITDLNSASTTVVIVAAGTADITAVYTDGRACGDVCHPIISADLDPDCVVNLLDFTVLANQWLTDNSVQ